MLESSENSIATDNIRLIALDLDGTLLNSHGELSPRNREAIDRARTAGVRIALVTGRRFRDARPIALELGLDIPLISHNGALTKHAGTLETVQATLLPAEAAREVVKIGRARDADAMVSDDPVGAGVLVYDHVNEGNHAFLGYLAWSRRIHGDEAAKSITQVDSLDEYLDHSPIHVSFSGSCSAMQQLAEDLKQALAEEVKVFATLYPRKDFALVDVLHPLASKGAGVAAAAAEIGLSAEEVMAIGDNFNDIEMLEFAGTSVVMANADERLQSVDGFHLTLANDEDGVAAAIERFVL